MGFENLVYKYYDLFINKPVNLNRVSNLKFNIKPDSKPI